MKKAEAEHKKEVAKHNAKNSAGVQDEANKITENLDAGGIKERLNRDLTVLITVRESLKQVWGELTELAKDKGNIEIDKKLDLAGQQLDSISGDA